MKLVLTLCLLLSLHLVRAQSAVATSADEKAIITTEKQRFDAQVSKDYAVLEKVLADDLIYNHSNGNSDNKQSFIQSLREGKANYTSIEPQQQRVRLYGNTAVVNGQCAVKMNNNNTPTEFTLRYTDVYVKKGNQWQMVTWQSLRLTN